MSEAKKGDVVGLAAGEGTFTDYETGLEVFNKETAVIGNVVGQRTKLALQSGGLVVISEKKTAKQLKDEAAAEAKAAAEAEAAAKAAAEAGAAAGK